VLLLQEVKIRCVAHSLGFLPTTSHTRDDETRRIDGSVHDLCCVMWLPVVLIFLVIFFICHRILHVLSAYNLLTLYCCIYCHMWFLALRALLSQNKKIFS